MLGPSQPPFLCLRFSRASAPAGSLAWCLVPFHSCRCKVLRPFHLDENGARDSEFTRPAAWRAKGREKGAEGKLLPSPLPPNPFGEGKLAK